MTGTGGIITDWQLSTEEGKDRIGQLEEWIHRPKEDLDFPDREYDAPYFTQNLEDLGQVKIWNFSALFHVMNCFTNSLKVSV